MDPILVLAASIVVAACVLGGAWVVSVWIYSQKVGDRNLDPRGQAAANRQAMGRMDRRVSHIEQIQEEDAERSNYGQSDDYES